ncbi:MAG: DUF1501 domain-containing protein [Balneolaceae bacterium]|nr:DUF1501 domain-containing protein [Balneolaceae bacterium]
MISRKAFLKSAAVSVFSIGMGGIPAFLNRSALAAGTADAASRRKILVAIFQRGAMDGLMAVPPIDDRHLAQLRPQLYMRPGRNSSLIDLDNGFALHPAFRPFEPYFRDGSLAIVHGIGSPNTTRSHFDAQDYMESGTPFDKGTSSGWLNRAVGLSGHDPTPFQALSMTKTMPKSFYGPHPALAIEKLEDFQIGNATGGAGVASDGFEAIYMETADRLLNDTGKESFEAVRMLKSLDIDRYRPSNNARYPNTPLGQSLRQIALLIKNDVGLEVAFAESGGWDTHVRQGTEQGSFANRAADLSNSIDAFWKDLESWRDRVVVMTMTEFGRTVKENGSGGTDHGRASCMFVLGEKARGGRVHGSIPTLAPEQLEDARDLPVTTDFRSLFAGVAGSHLDIPDGTQLFPGWKGNPMNILRG